MVSPLRTLVLALTLLALTAAVAHADTFTVTSLADEADDGECAVDCTLREAIGRANATDARDVVHMPAGRVTLSQGQLTVTRPIELEGVGARSSIIDGNDTTRVLEIASTIVEESVIRDLMVTKGNANSMSTGPAGDGGGILVSNDRPIRLLRVWVHDNTATAAGAGFAKLPESGTNAPITIIGSTFSANEIAGGMGNGIAAGVGAFGPLLMENTTITGNVASNPGTNEGAGLVTSSGPATLSNVTISDNRINGAAGTAVGAGMAGNSLTTVGQGSGVTPANAAVMAQNTIISGNTINGETIEDCELVTATSSSNNISTAEGCGFTDAASRQNTNPLLLPLGDYGGPVDTRRLSPTSPVIDHGTNDGCPAIDARGVSRPLGGSCDPGAVETATPVATGLTPSNVTFNAASLNGSVTNPSPTVGGSAYIEYGPTLAYGSKTPAVAFGPGAAGFPIGARIEGLQPSSEYHFRIVVANDEQTVNGPDGTTKTAAAPVPKPPVAPAQKAKPKISFKGSSSARKCLRTSYKLKIKTTIAKGLKLKSVRVTLDGKRKGGVKKKTSQTLKISVRKLKKGRHTLKITATDTANRSTTVTRKFTRCGARRRR
jgi:CSLREA domain-containing protein